MRTVLHVLPHPGGGAETYIDLLEELDGYEHQRVALSVTRSRLRGVPSVLGRRRALRRLAREADLVHVHGDMAAMLVAPGLRDRPLVITTHGLHRLRRSTGLAGRLVRRRLRAAVAASAMTICIAGDERDDLAAALPSSLHSRLVVVANGVAVAEPAEPAQRRQARESLGLAEGDVVALFVGQLEQRKDPLGAIAAVEAARAARRRARPAGRRRRPARAGGRRPRGCGGAGARTSERPRGPLHGGRSLPPPVPSRGDVVRAAGGDGTRAGTCRRRRHRQRRDRGSSGRGLPGWRPRGDGDTALRSGRRPGRACRARRRGRERIATELSLERFLDGTREQYEAAIAAAAAQGA